MALPKMIAVVGTNASGKSSVGLKLARKFNGEILSADSRQIYRGFDLCSGKVTQEERLLVPHHLLDIKEIGEPFSVADFQGLAYALIPQILSRGKLPFLVGGTGLYIGSVVHGYIMNEESPDIALREALEPLTIDELKAKLTPDGKAFLEARPSDYWNKRRIIRVLEKTAHGEPLNYENAPRYDVLQLGVTWPKEQLAKRIEERLNARLEQGMLGEVEAYLAAGGDRSYLYDLGLEYRYILWYLTGKFSSREEFCSELSRAIRQFAKRQMTWFRRDKSILWIDMSADPMAQAEVAVREFLGNDGKENLS